MIRSILRHTLYSNFILIIGLGLIVKFKNNHYFPELMLFVH